MCFIADPWFRGMDLMSGADGGVFIADWSDTGECHELGGVHRTSGRIYKLTFGEIRAGNKFDLVNASGEQLVQMQLQKKIGLREGPACYCKNTRVLESLLPLSVATAC